MTYLIWALAIAVLIAQHFISKQKKAILGGIIPIIYTGVVIWWLVVHGINSKMDIIAAVLGLIILLITWIEGYESYKKKQKKELDKISTHDMK